MPKKSSRWSPAERCWWRTKSRTICINQYKWNYNRTKFLYESDDRCTQNGKLFIQACRKAYGKLHQYSSENKSLISPSTDATDANFTTTSYVGITCFGADTLHGCMWGLQIAYLLRMLYALPHSYQNQIWCRCDLSWMCAWAYNELKNNIFRFFIFFNCIFLLTLIVRWN